ncbi:MAG TPA: SDR family oxidoreductase [Chloroflexota bacterium]|nr:SDR family oxidoreductase [Chloroflexota bacterium]
MAGKLDGKVVLLVGSSPNINAGIGLGMAEEGAKLVCVDIQPSFAAACAEAINTGGGEAIAVVCDVTKEDQVKAAVESARKEFGGVDVLVNGAVIQIRKGLREMSVEEFRKQIDVILAGCFMFTKHTAELMIQQGRKGNIINIISTEGHQGNPGNIGYGTAKSGLLNFTRAVAMELAEFGIRVNSLTPTGTDPSEGLQRAKEWGLDWQLPNVGRRPGFAEGDGGVPLRKRPLPHHYAKAAVFLASDDAEMITGFDLRVDGGTIARYWRWMPGTE